MKLFPSLFVFLLLVSIELCGQYVKDVQIKGNEITNDDIILDYLGVSAGDTLICESLTSWSENAKLRLKNSSLFLSVDIAWERGGDEIVIYVLLQERWYYWLYPILEHADRNFASFLESRDWSRINYGLSFEKHNFRGRDEFLKLKLRIGYRSQIGIMYDVPWIQKNKAHGFQFSVDKFNQKKLIVSVSDDKPVYLFDELGDGLSEFRFRAIWHYRVDAYNGLHILSEYQKFGFSQFLKDKAPDYLFQKEHDFQKYLSLSMRWISDFRNDKFYPTKGQFVDVGIVKNGLGVLSSPVNLLRLEIEANDYREFSDKYCLASEFYLTSQLINRNHIPFMYSTLLGFDNYPRGYDYYLVQAYQAVGLNESFRYKLYQSGTKDLQFIPIEEFRPFQYSVFAYCFFDMAYSSSSAVYLNENNLPSKFLYSCGLGVDLVTYYDRSFGFYTALTNQKAFGIFAAFRSPMYKIF